MPARLAGLLAIAAPGAALPAGLPNPGFEQGLDGWTVADGEAFSVEPRRSDARRRAAQGGQWLSVHWGSARIPGDEEARISTRIDARPYAGRRLRLTASTWIPGPADRRVRMFVRLTGPSGDRVHALPLMSSDRHWRRQGLAFAVPHEAREIEIGFLVPGRDGALDVDALRLEPARR